ncbi:BQ2448_5281 [Microbotryum intermedium]|uniref:BQ2448_5281 protein n=1 Tax=Microbotryum intermedium TaxID=269621 RepID=A0A238F0K8_9BASI|nr:BQ2448_5281 [Microbotryum intermedium]
MPDLVCAASRTNPELTSPPVTGSSTSVSSKVAAPIPAAGGRAATHALASRRESVTVKDSLANSGSEGGAAAFSSSPEEKKHALKEFAEDGRHFSLVRNFRLADIVTLGNGFCGALSIFSSAKYLLTADRTYLWSIQLKASSIAQRHHTDTVTSAHRHAVLYPVGGFIFDAFDGKVARWRNESSMLGQELDSLADSISFGVAPAVAAFCIGLRTPADTFVLTTFICAGIARLARFNATVALVPKDDTGKSKYFEGLPIPSSLFLVGVMAYLVKLGMIDGPGGRGSGLPGGIILPLREALGIDLHYAAVVWFVWAMMMVSKTLRIPKL